MFAILLYYVVGCTFNAVYVVFIFAITAADLHFDDAMGRDLPKGQNLNPIPFAPRRDVTCLFRALLLCAPCQTDFALESGARRILGPDEVARLGMIGRGPCTN
jgi:hypothetical protein